MMIHVVAQTTAGRSRKVGISPLRAVRSAVPAPIQMAEPVKLVTRAAARLGMTTPMRSPSPSPANMEEKAIILSRVGRVSRSSLTVSTTRATNARERSAASRMSLLVSSLMRGLRGLLVSLLRRSTDRSAASLAMASVVALKALVAASPPWTMVDSVAVSSVLVVGLKLR